MDIRKIRIQVLLVATLTITIEIISISVFNEQVVEQEAFANKRPSSGEGLSQVSRVSFRVSFSRIHVIHITWLNIPTEH